MGLAINDTPQRCQVIILVDGSGFVRCGAREDHDVHDPASDVYPLLNHTYDPLYTDALAGGRYHFEEE